MVDTQAAGFVFGTALLAWLVAVTVTAGWSEPPILFWAAVLTFGAAAMLYAAETVDVAT